MLINRESTKSRSWLQNLSSGEGQGFPLCVFERWLTHEVTGGHVAVAGLILRTVFTPSSDQCGRGSMMNSVPDGSWMVPFSNDTEPQGEDNETGFCHKKRAPSSPWAEQGPKYLMTRRCKTSSKGHLVVLGKIKTRENMKSKMRWVPFSPLKLSPYSSAKLPYLKQSYLGQSGSISPSEPLVG